MCVPKEKIKDDNSIKSMEEPMKSLVMPEVHIQKVFKKPSLTLQVWGFVLHSYWRERAGHSSAGYQGEVEADGHAPRPTLVGVVKEA